MAELNPGPRSRAAPRPKARSSLSETRALSKGGASNVSSAPKPRVLSYAENMAMRAAAAAEGVSIKSTEEGSVKLATKPVPRKSIKSITPVALAAPVIEDRITEIDAATIGNPLLVEWGSTSTPLRPRSSDNIHTGGAPEKVPSAKATTAAHAGPALSAPQRIPTAPPHVAAPIDASRVATVEGIRGDFEIELSVIFVDEAGSGGDRSTEEPMAPTLPIRCTN